LKCRFVRIASSDHYYLIAAYTLHGAVRFVLIALAAALRLLLCCCVCYSMHNMIRGPQRQRPSDPLPREIIAALRYMEEQQNRELQRHEDDVSLS
jgi:hypothetical protein